MKQNMGKGEVLWGPLHTSPGADEANTGMKMLL
jgi:hypothetical protein